MGSHADDRAVLVGDNNVRIRLHLGFVDARDGVGGRERVTEVDGVHEAHMIVAVRCAGNRRLVLLLDKGRGGAAECEGEHAVDDTGAVARALHERLVEMHLAEVAGDAAELVDV